MRFSQFLVEQKEKHTVFAFGRMNPPTTGHEVLVNKVKDLATKYGANHLIVLSHTQDKEKNPLTPEQKLKYSRLFFPKTNIELATKDEPSFLAHAAKLNKSGTTHLHMVAGSDRIEEYKKLLQKYNGTQKGALFNFKGIEVHSAGERDPDAEGTTGMSASKMRAAASAGNYEVFKKGVPAKVNEKYKRELYDDVRKGMHLKENLNEEFEYFLLEGVHDKGIFKAVFLGGGPGSGKDFVLDKTLAGHGLTEINSDKAFEFLMDKENLDMKMPESETEARNLVRGRAKNMTEIKQRLALMGRNGVIINGTGDDPEKIKKIKGRLEELGYDTSMIMVNTRDDVSQQRNIERGQRGGRTVPEEIRKEKWDAVQSARPQYAELFGDNYTEFENSEDLRQTTKEIKDQKEAELNDIYKNVLKFVSKSPSNDVAKSWVAAELEKKDTLKVDSKKEVAPHEGSKAAEEARRLGLSYYGFGRYGKNGKVTHRSVHDSLVEVKPQVDNSKNVPVASSSGSGIRLSTLQSKQKEKLQKIQQKSPLKKLKNEDFDSDFENMLSESYQLSDSGALNMLLLGTKIVDTSQVVEEDTSKYITDNKGEVRVFKMRRSAATEAHQKNGTVQPHKDGYVVKLNKGKVNEHFSENERYILTEEQERGGIPSFGRTLTEGTNYTGSSSSGTRTKGEAEAGRHDSKKITIEEIRRKQKSLIESIDKNIEPGVSMSGSGESIARDTGEKINKKGKATPIQELTGDETTASIGAQKEDQLKKQGISLTTFKSKRFI